jgi:hypothetical protein
VNYITDVEDLGTFEDILHSELRFRSGSEVDLTWLRRIRVQWQDLGHPYDRAHALNGMRHALILSGYKEGDQSAAQQSMGLVETLAEQLDDTALKSLFLDSVLVQEIRALLAGS